MSAGRYSAGDRVRVELADGYNCVGTVRRDHYDSQGRRTVLIEDSLGERRAVHPRRPSVTIHVLDESGGGSA